MKKAFRAAFPATLPVFFGYAFIGLAFGLTLTAAGFSAWWAPAMSVFIYAGSMQFVTVALLSGGAGLLQAAFMTFVINFRHLFYGITFLDDFRRMGKAKPYMIFSLTDETYSLLCSAPPPEGVDKRRFFLAVSMLNQVYWVLGSAAGAVLGEAVSFNAAGVDFAMTALFVSIATEQWLSAKNRRPALTGLACALLSLALFGADRFIPPAMLLSAGVLLLLRPKKAADQARAAKGGDAV